jgi:hypothetical protein
MSALKRKERSSDSPKFDSIQGDYPHFILSVCHNQRRQLRKDLILSIKTKLNHRADSQSAHATLVTELYELATLSERLHLLRSNSSQSLLDHSQADVLDREGLSIYPALLGFLATSFPNRNLFMEPFELYASPGG